MTQVEKALRMLRMAGSAGITNAQFAQNFILRYGEVMSTLRKRGHTIETVKPERGNVWRYILTNDIECKCKESGEMFCPVRMEGRDRLHG
jgi:predicted flavoprotein YhiN